MSFSKAHNLESLKRILVSSLLYEEEQHYLFELAQHIHHTQLNALVEVLEEHPEYVQKIYQNVLTKHTFFEQGNTAGWETLLENEYNELKEVTELS